MINLNTLLTLQGSFFLMVLAGVFFRRRVVGAEFQKGLSAVMMDLILPCNIIAAFQTELSAGMLSRSLQALLISLAGQLLAMVMSPFLFRRADPDRQCVMKFAGFCSNASFLGIPVAMGIWGSEGVLLASFYLVPQRIFMYTVGQAYFSSGKGTGGLWKKLLTTPCLAAVLVGLVLMLARWRLPGMLLSAVNDLSRCTTGMSMFLVGMLIAQLKRSDFMDRGVLLLSGLRLIVQPGIVYLCCRLLHADPLAAGVSVMLMAMPIEGATTALMASRYDRAERFSASVITVSTLLSVITTPLWGLILI